MPNNEDSMTGRITHQIDLEPSEDICVSTLARGDERWIFVYFPSQLDQLANVCGRFALDRALAFTWQDAAAVMNQARGNA